MEENNIRKAPLPEETLDQVNAGYIVGGYNMTVGDCYGGYLALRPEPVWDQYHEILRLRPGYRVFTYGQTTNGTGLNGVPCTYRYVSYNGIWGWVVSDFLRR